MSQCLKCAYYKNGMCTDYKEKMENGTLCTLYTPITKEGVKNV